MTAIDPTDLRVFVYDRIVSRGFPPTVAEIASAHRVSPAVAREELGSLNIGKTIVTDSESGEILMAGPFAAAQTDYRVESRSGVWWANCAWDALGISMIINEQVRIHTECRDCGESLEAGCAPDLPPDSDSVVHFLLPADRWYEDIRFT